MITRYEWDAQGSLLLRNAKTILNKEQHLNTQKTPSFI